MKSETGPFAAGRGAPSFLVQVPMVATQALFAATLDFKGTAYWMFTLGEFSDFFLNH
ncbi:MAG: hypothetical protein ACKOQ9_07065 [Verrucomicrobiota bacterium]